MKSRAFTLVELLVVVGIIGLLTAILLPTLAGARRHANAIECASNLRQIAAGWTMYGNAYNGTSCPGRPPELPPPSTNLYHVGNGEVWRPRWYALLGGQSGMSPFTNPDAARSASNTLLVDNKAFLCPEVPEWDNARNYPFGYNFQFLGNMRYNSALTRYIHFPVKAGSIKAAETVMAADSMGTAAGKRESQRLEYERDGSGGLEHRGNHGWSIDPPRLTADSDYSDYNNRLPEHRSAPDPRHSNRANVAFCDGHVERMSLEDLGYVVNPDGSVATDGPGATNKWFSGTGQDIDPPSVN